MTLRHLRIFVMVYREMSITKAASKLYMTQPSVSLAVRELEEHYQVRLFNRINRRIFATEKGDQLYEYAKQITELTDETERIMRMPDMPVKLHIGSSITIGNTILPEVVKKFQEKYKDCEIQVTIQNSRKIVQAVVKNEQDIGLVEDKPGSCQLEEMPFCCDNFHFVCGSHHPLASKKEVTLDEIAEYPFFMREPGSASREVLESVMRMQQIKYRVLWESTSNQAIIHGLKMLDGISVLSGRILEEEIKKETVKLLPIQPKEFNRQFSLIYHKRKNMPEALKYLIQILMEQE